MFGNKNAKLIGVGCVQSMINLWNFCQNTSSSCSKHW